MRCYRANDTFPEVVLIVGYFKPTPNEIRICRLLPTGCDDLQVTFQDAFDGELFISKGNESYTRRRMARIDEVVDKFGLFLVQFDIHMHTTNGQVDANGFAPRPNFLGV